MDKIDVLETSLAKDQENHLTAVRQLGTELQTMILSKRRRSAKRKSTVDRKKRHAKLK